jgi:ribosomal protein S13
MTAKGKNGDLAIKRRVLIYIPIIHTETDMGGLGETLRKAALKEVGLKSWRRKQDLTKRMWDRIETAIQDLNLAHPKVRLYQDGLPVCGTEAEIVRDLANAGSRNHRILIGLIERGATLMGTESAELLVQEYELMKQMMAGHGDADRAEVLSHQKRMSERVLRERDQHIAHRINTTLEKGETGILFLGMLHSLDRLLDKDIRVTYPLYKPASRGG